MTNEYGMKYKVGNTGHVEGMMLPLVGLYSKDVAMFHMGLDVYENEEGI